MKTVRTSLYFSRDNSIREATATLSQVKGKMTTSSANDALADLLRLPQEGGTVSHLLKPVLSSFPIGSSSPTSGLDKEGELEYKFR